MSALCVFFVCAFMFLRSRKNAQEPTNTKSLIPDMSLQTTQTIQPMNTIIQNVTSQQEKNDVSESEKLTELSMDYYLLPGHVPGTTTPIKVVPRRTGLPVFAAVSCDSPDDNTVAIRHDGKYLTVITPSICRFETRKIGASCFTIVPGFCGQGDFAMFRHASSGKFLRASMEGEDEELYTLVCKDAPTTENYRLFCWKLAAPARQNMYSDKFCGCKVDSSGVETCYPCDEDKAAQADTIGPFPELVGFTVDNAKAVLAAKHPNVLTVEVSCPSDQTECRPVVYKDRQTVTLFFDPQTGRVNRVPSVVI